MLGCRQPPEVYLADIGGERLFNLETVAQPSWTRVVGGPGELNVAIPNSQCWRLANRLEAYEAELVVLVPGRDGRPRTEWAGPLTKIVLQNGEPGLLTAAGSSVWWSQRGLADDARYDEVKPDAIDALVHLNNQAMGVDGRPGITLHIIDRAFVVAEGTYLRADGIYISEVASKLYETGAIVWSEEGRSIVCGPPAWGPPLTLNETDVKGQPRLTKNGARKATRALLFGQGVTGEARLTDATAERRSGVLELLAHDDRVSLQDTANRIAKEKLAASRTGWTLTFDGSTELDPYYRFDRQDLIPGRLVTAAFNVSGINVQASFMLTKVTFYGSGAVQIDVAEYSPALVAGVEALSDVAGSGRQPAPKAPGAGPRVPELPGTGDSIGRGPVPQAGGTGATGPSRGAAPRAFD